MFKINLYFLSISLVIISAVGIYSWKLSLVIARQLPAAEIQEYWGENISNGNNLRENSLKGSGRIDLAQYFLVVDGLVARPARYSIKQLMKMPGVEKMATLYGIAGLSARIIWEGLLVNDILNAVGVSPRAKRAVFYGADGYTAVLPLDIIREKKVMVAYKMNGMTLAKRGFPTYLVAEQKLGNKWLKPVTRIELSECDNSQSYGVVSLCDSNYGGMTDNKGYQTEYQTRDKEQIIKE
ncbi:MAG: molybdopterin-dependent oxidoreductase [Firmicutes bacterium]|nr:molybdopterin-dependent oxidoreductase [Bacillota bacterium]